jgi:Holliday junction resolvase
LLEEAGWAVIRVSSAMMSRPDVILDRVRAKLRAAGAPI